MSIYQVLLIAVALERLGDSRADAAYARAAALGPDDPLVRLNLAGRHARAGRLSDAVEEASIVAQLLQVEKSDAQVRLQKEQIVEVTETINKLWKSTLKVGCAKKKTGNV